MDQSYSLSYLWRVLYRTPPSFLSKSSVSKAISLKNQLFYDWRRRYQSDKEHNGTPKAKKIDICDTAIISWLASEMNNHTERADM